MNEQIRVHSIYKSISGEAGMIPQGAPCTVLRLQGCDLTCPWCDVKDSWGRGEGRTMLQGEIIEKLDDDKNKSSHLLITGGEPLLQAEGLNNLLNHPALPDYHITQLETNGRHLWEYDGIDCIVYDYKLPSSNTISFSPLIFLQRIINSIHDHINVLIKFVIANDNDYEHTLNFMRVYQNNKETVQGCYADVRFAVSNVQGDDDFNGYTNREFVERVLKESLFDDKITIINCQIHKFMGVK